MEYKKTLKLAHKRQVRLSLPGRAIEVAILLQSVWMAPAVITLAGACTVLMPAGRQAIAEGMSSVT